MSSVLGANFPCESALVAKGPPMKPGHSVGALHLIIRSGRHSRFCHRSYMPCPPSLPPPIRRRPRNLEWPPSFEWLLAWFDSLRWLVGWLTRAQFNSKSFYLWFGQNLILGKNELTRCAKILHDMFIKTIE